MIWDVITLKDITKIWNDERFYNSLRRKALGHIICTLRCKPTGCILRTSKLNFEYHSANWSLHSNNQRKISSKYHEQCLRDLDVGSIYRAQQEYDYQQVNSLVPGKKFRSFWKYIFLLRSAVSRIFLLLNMQVCLWWSHHVSCLTVNFCLLGVCICVLISNNGCRLLVFVWFVKITGATWRLWCILHGWNLIV